MVVVSLIEVATRGAALGKADYDRVKKNFLSWFCHNQPTSLSKIIPNAYISPPLPPPFVMHHKRESNNGANSGAQRFSSSPTTRTPMEDIILPLF